MSIHALPLHILRVISEYFYRRTQTQTLRCISVVFAETILPPNIYVEVPSARYSTLKSAVSRIQQLYHQTNPPAHIPEIRLVDNIHVKNWTSIHHSIVINGDPTNQTVITGAGFLIQPLNKKTTVALSHLKMVSTTAQGIFASGDCSINLTNVIIESSGSSGILVREQVALSLRRCSIRKSRAMGLFVINSKVIAEDVLIQDNRWTGICAVSQSRVTLKGSETRVEGNGAGVQNTSSTLSTPAAANSSSGLLFDLKACTPADEFWICKCCSKTTTTYGGHGKFHHQ